MNWVNVEEIFSLQDFTGNNSVEFDHPDLTERIKKTLYYAPHKNPSKDTLSFPLTKAAVESFRKAAPTPCGKLGPRYASRVARDACLSPCAMILSLIYIERLIHKNPEYLQRIQSSDLFLISMMIASKYLYDEGMSDEVYNDEWAISGQVDTDYVNQLEAEFLHAIEWRIFTRKEEFYDGLSLLEARLAFLEGRERGWHTYTELCGIFASKRVNQNILKIVALLTKTVCLSMLLYSGMVVLSFGLAALVRQPAIQPQEDVSKNAQPELNHSHLHLEAELLPDQSYPTELTIFMDSPIRSAPQISSSTPHSPHCPFAHKSGFGRTQTNHSMSSRVHFPTSYLHCRHNLKPPLNIQAQLKSTPSSHSQTTAENQRFGNGFSPPIPAFAGALSLPYFPFYQQHSTLPSGKVF